MSMVPVYIEISEETLEAVLKDNQLLDAIIYNGDKKLASIDLISLDTEQEVFEALYEFIKNEDEDEDIEDEDEKNSEQENNNVLSYDDFPGYHISYETPTEVHEHFENFLKEIARDKIQYEGLLEWYDTIYDFYQTATKNGSAVLYCIT